MKQAQTQVFVSGVCRACRSVSGTHQGIAELPALPSVLRHLRSESPPLLQGEQHTIESFREYP